ncbi:hypothetical protein M9458_044231, partial [Cirrhinus mrigala]
YVSKVPTSHFRVLVRNLQALPLEEADLPLMLLCPVHAIHIYMDRTWNLDTPSSSSLPMGQQMGNAALEHHPLGGRLRVELHCPDTLGCQHLFLNYVTRFRIVAFFRGDPKYV